MHVLIPSGNEWYNETVQRYDLRKERAMVSDLESPIVGEDPTRPNLRQVHLIHSELFDEVRKAGFHVKPGQMGENITTRGIDLLSLPTGAKLRLGDHAVIKSTGLRNPCAQNRQLSTGTAAGCAG